MNDGSSKIINKIMTINILSLDGKNFELRVPSDITILELKKEIALKYYDSDKSREFKDDALLTDLTNRFNIKYQNKYLKEDQLTIKDYNINNNSLLHFESRYSSTNLNIVICKTDDLEFTVHWTRYDYYTVGPFKQALSQLIGIPCTSLYLKRTDVTNHTQQNDNFYVFNDDEQIPCSAIIHATLNGKINITNLYLSFGDEKNKMTTSNINIVNPRQNVCQVSEIFNAPNLTTNNYESKYKLFTITGLISGSIIALWTQIAIPIFNVNTYHSISYSKIACITTLGATSGAIIGFASSYIYEQYFKPQHNRSSQDEITRD